MKYWAWATLVAALLAGCATSTQQAPVIERAPPTAKPEAKPAASKPAAPKKAVSAEKATPDWRPETYVVKKGDTLYALGLEFGYDYKDIARWNDIAAPTYTIKIGQTLKLKAPAVAAVAETAPATEGAVVSVVKTEAPPVAKPLDEPISKPVEAKPAEVIKPVEKPAEKVVDDEAVDWGWPTDGKVLAKFSDTNKGLDIAGTEGQPILAAASGKVVYSGSGLRGYGKMVIIKHNKTYLSAYAHNKQILVKEGAEVTKGMKIAEMGNSDADSVKLHFEIRKLGQPTDPEKFLAAR